MLKVDSGLEKTDHTRRRNRQKKATGGGGFTSMLEKAVMVNRPRKNTSSAADRFDELYEQLTDAEDRLLAAKSVREFNLYRETVRKMASLINREGLRFRQYTDRYTNRSTTVLFIIDQKMADLLKQITAKNPEVPRILRMLGEIRGILLDETA